MQEGVKHHEYPFHSYDLAPFELGPPDKPANIWGTIYIVYPAGF